MNSTSAQNIDCGSDSLPLTEEDQELFAKTCGCLIPPTSWHSTAEVVLSKLLLIISIFGNMLVIIVLQRMKRRTQFNAVRILIQNLSFADLCVCILYNLNEAVAIDSAFTTDAWCKIFGGLLWTTLSASSCLICSVSIERYLAVVRPLEFNSLNTTKAVLMVVFSWYYSFLFSIQDFCFLRKLEYPYCGRAPVPVCTYDLWRGTDITLVSLATVSATFLLPVLVILYTNITVVLTMVRSKGARYFLKSNTRSGHRRRSVILIVLLLTATFVVCSLPFASFTIMNAVSVQPPVLLPYIAYYLMLVNSTANAFVYSFFSAEFRKRCKALCLSPLNCLRWR